MGTSVLDITVGGASPDTATSEAAAAEETRQLVAELAEFLQDPIGFGHYDWDDPIGLDEFVGATHHRGRYLEPLAW